MSLLDVFDLPQLYTKPPADALLDTLALLRSAPPSWEPSDNEELKNGSRNLGTRKAGKSRAPQINPEGVTRYLTGIVSSSLRWIEDDAVKEEIWDEASRRLSERSGRSGMGAISRPFRIPSSSGFFDLMIHEPALTGDDLGLKTWAASYLLAKRLHTLDIVRPGRLSKPQVLELGSGTGLVGLAMASLGADVVLTDLPSIFSNLAHNVRNNLEVVERNGGLICSGVLDWTKPTDCKVMPPDAVSPDEESVLVETKFPVILAADSLYSPEHPQWLVETIATWLSEDEDAKVIVEFPLRDAYLPEVKNFRERMQKIGLQIVQEGEESGYDDWGWSGANEDDNEKALVKCWWSCWGRAGLELK